MNTRVKIILPLFLLVLVFSSCKDNQIPVKGDYRLKVKVAVVQEREIAFPIHSSGILSLKEEMKLSFKTGGIISKINVEEGEKVRKGSLLAELNMAEIQASVDKAQIGLEKADRDFQRVNNLFQDSVATLEQLQNTSSALDLAKSNFDIAQFNKRHSVIIAPDDGLILHRLSEPNEMIAPGYPVIVFASTTKDWIFRLNISDIDIVKIAVKDSAIVKFDAYPERSFKAIVSQKAKAADPYTGTFEVELKLTDYNNMLMSGLIGSVDIIPSNKEKLIEIPYMAMLEGDKDECYVYVLDETNKPIKKRLKISGIGSDSFYAKTGIIPGARVITDGAAYIKKDTEIDIVE